jgi:ferredoxin
LKRDYFVFWIEETGIKFETRKGKVMRVSIEDTCTACGLCVDTCPEVFEMGDEMAQVIVDEVPAEYEEAVQQAADECPVEAIMVD